MSNVPNLPLQFFNRLIRLRGLLLDYIRNVRYRLLLLAYLLHYELLKILVLLNHLFLALQDQSL